MFSLNNIHKNMRERPWPVFMMPDPLESGAIKKP
nr:MAG TPA: hypothetical protein [Caudoviricetes sp.]